MKLSPNAVSTVQPETKFQDPTKAPGISESASTPIPSKDNLDADYLNEHLKEQTKVSHKRTVVRMFLASGMSAVAFSAFLLKEYKLDVSHDSLTRWAKKLKAGKSLKRKRYTWNNQKEADAESIRLQHQMNYAVGHVSAIGSGFHQAWLELSRVSEPMGWGKAMTFHALRHRWRKMPVVERDYYTMERQQHYKKYAATARAIGLLPNEIWQVDELQFKVPVWMERELDMYAVACVDRATQVCRGMEFSLVPINKTSFQRAVKGFFLGQSAIATKTAKPEVITVDNAKFHEPPDIKKTEFDFRLACEGLEILPHWNDKHTPQQNTMVENWNGKFKSMFLPGLLEVMGDLAPAKTLQDTAALLAYAVEAAEQFIRHWNTTPDETGQSRMDRYLQKAKPESFAVTEAEIDRSVRVTVLRTVGKYGIILGNDEYFVAKELVDYARRKLRIRIRPEGAGNDVDAYFGSEPVATLTRPEANSGLKEQLVRAYNKQEEKFRARQEEQMARFRDIHRQLLLKDLPPDSPLHALVQRADLIKAKRKATAERRAGKLARKSAPPRPPMPKPQTTSSPADDQDQTINSEIL